MQALSTNLISSLALDLAQNLDAPDVIANRYGMTIAQLTELASHEAFEAVYLQALTEWQAIANTEDRIRVKALMAVERRLTPLVDMMNAEKNGPGVAMDAMKLLVKLSGMEKPAAFEGVRGQPFSITINIPPSPMAPGITHDAITINAVADVGEEDADGGEFTPGE